MDIEDSMSSNIPEDPAASPKVTEEDAATEPEKGSETTEPSEPTETAQVPASTSEPDEATEPTGAATEPTGTAETAGNAEHATGSDQEEDKEEEELATEAGDAAVPENPTKIRKRDLPATKRSARIAKRKKARWNDKRRYTKKSILMARAAKEAMEDASNSATEGNVDVEGSPKTPQISEELMRIKGEPEEFDELDQLLDAEAVAEVNCTTENCETCREQQRAFCFLHFHECLLENKKCIVCCSLSLHLVENSTHSSCRELFCVFCNINFSELEALKGHKCPKLMARNYNCSDCEQDFKNITLYYRHILNGHCGIEQVMCPKCTVMCPDKACLEQHMAIAHPSRHLRLSISSSPERDPRPTNTPDALRIPRQLKRRSDASELPTPSYKSPPRPPVLREKSFTGVRRDRNLPSILKRDKSKKLDPLPETIRFDADDDEIPKLVKISEDKGTGSKLYRYVSGGTASEGGSRVYQVVPVAPQNQYNDETEDDGAFSDSADESAESADGKKRKKSSTKTPRKIKSEDGDSSMQTVCSRGTCATCFDRQAALCMLEFHQCPVLAWADAPDCVVCTQIASHLQLIARDKAVHVGGAIVRCVFCYTVFDDMGLLKKHKCDAEEDMRCRQCGVIQNGQVALCTHLFYHFKINAFECHKCKKLFVTERKFNAHQREHQFTPKYACHFCDKKFHKTRELQNHLYRHGVTKPFKCTKCGRSFAAHYQLRLHLETHEKHRTFQCPLCPRSFIKARALQHHEFTFHSSEGFQCDLCFRVMSTPMRLRNHLKCHEEQRPYKCELCGHGYANKGSLNRHMRVHTTDVLKCDYPLCTYTTHYEFQLRSHKFVHATIKPFSCHSCQDCSFLTKRSLIKHFDKVHNGLNQNFGSDGNPMWPRRGRPYQTGTLSDDGGSEGRDSADPNENENSVDVEEMSEDVLEVRKIEKREVAPPPPPKEELEVVKTKRRTYIDDLIVENPGSHRPFSCRICTHVAFTERIYCLRHCLKAHPGYNLDKSRQSNDTENHGEGESRFEDNDENSGGRDYEPDIMIEEEVTVKPPTKFVASDTFLKVKSASQRPIKVDTHMVVLKKAGLPFGGDGMLKGRTVNIIRANPKQFTQMPLQRVSLLKNNPNGQMVIVKKNAPREQPPIALSPRIKILSVSKPGDKQIVQINSKPVQITNKPLQINSKPVQITNKPAQLRPPFATVPRIVTLPKSITKFMGGVPPKLKGKIVLKTPSVVENVDLTDDAASEGTTGENPETMEKVMVMPNTPPATPMEIGSVV